MAKALVPREVLEFVKAGKALHYDVAQSTVGHIRLCKPRELETVDVEFTTDESDFRELDPYSFLGGHYHVEAVNLVAESDDYEPLGILGWIPHFQCFGTWDSEHATLLLFEGATWPDIVAEPGRYLDEQWERVGVGIVPRTPWLDLPFHLGDCEYVIEPYRDRCALHGRALERGVRRPYPKEIAGICNALRARNPEAYLEALETEFPHAGVPCSGSELLFCGQCFDAEENWLTAAQKTHAVSATEDGIIRCPECGIAFSLDNRRSFADGVHQTCGTRLIVKLPGGKVLE